MASIPPLSPQSSRLPQAAIRSVAHAALCGALVWLLMLSVALADDQKPTPTPLPTPSGPDPTALFNSILADFDRGDYQNAVSSIDTLLKQVPTDLPEAEKIKFNRLLEPIYFTRGAAYFNLKQYPQAITALADYVTRYPRSTRLGEVSFSLAEAHYFNKDYAVAAQKFVALESYPVFHEEALLLEGVCYRELNEDKLAIAALEKLTGPGIRSPTAARGGMQLIFLYGRDKQPQKALAMLSKVQANIDQLENVVELNSVALALGDDYLENNANQEALTCYRAVRTREQVISIEHARIAALQKRLDDNRAASRANPKEAGQYLLSNRRLLDSIGEDQRLIDTFEKLPEIYPKVLYRIGRAYSQLTRPWEANVAYQDCYARTTDPADREAALYSVVTAYVDANQAASARVACNQYLKEFPQGANVDTVGYLLGATALQENDPESAARYFGQMLASQPASTMREEMRFLLANADLAQGKNDEAKTQYTQYLHDYPEGTHAEESVYRLALCALFTGDYDAALSQLDAFLKKYPTSSFTSDAQYRRSVCRYAMNKYDEVIGDMQAWLQHYPKDPEQGEVEALLADSYIAEGKTDDALAAYQKSFQTATTDEVLNYSLLEAGKILQKRGDWAADAAMFESFVKKHPNHPSVVVALAQIGHAEMKLGKVDEAKHFLADTLNKYIDDRRRGSVEQILDQLALLCVRKKPRIAPNPPPPQPGATAAATPDTAPGGTAKSAVAENGAAPAASPVVALPAATPAPDPAAELDELLGASLADRSPTAQARILYAKAQLARLRRQPAEADRQLLAIAAQFKPAVLSAVILGQVGDALLGADRLDDAAREYQELYESFPKDDNVDFAYAGLGEIAFRKKEFDKALGYFRDGTDKIAANQKLKDLTVGQAKSLLALGKLDEAAKIFEQAASVKEWRGETTAFCMYSLGQIEAQKGHWVAANGYYQRIFLGYGRFLPWVAKAYLGSGDSLEKLGKTQDAVKTYQEMLSNPKLGEFAEAGIARERLKALGAG
jgi:TolA-binding protein